MLLRAGQVVSLDELAEILRDPGPLPSARVTIQNYVMRLRRALGDTDGSRISTESRGYVIRVIPGELDVTRFEALVGAAREAARDSSWDTAATNSRAALSPWPGEPLSDVDSEVLAASQGLRELHRQMLVGNPSLALRDPALPAARAAVPRELAGQGRAFHRPHQRAGGAEQAAGRPPPIRCRGRW